MNGQQAALTVASVTQTTGLFLAVLPGMEEMRKTSEGTQLAAEVRTAECLATGLSLGTAVVMSLVAKSNAPIYAAFLTAGTMVIVTEYALRRTHKATLRLVTDGESQYTEGIPHE